MLVELVDMRQERQVQILQSHGIDPLHYLVIPRVWAFALSAFCLTQVFVVLALGTGYIVANSLGVTEVSAVEFINRVLAGMDITELSVAVRQAFEHRVRHRLLIVLKLYPHRKQNFVSRPYCRTA